MSIKPSHLREQLLDRDSGQPLWGAGYRDYRHTLDNRLMSAGNNGYTHDDNGFRSIWSNRRYVPSVQVRTGLPAAQNGGGGPELRLHLSP
ncbi:hypothetical protein [Pseudodesulfovibrio piezophilus]|uniref:hypothetical protein n=1 Tax=Pseudodesulfovibrio piezophilus TaxID=879567 RepID=UPI001E4458E5|nr:hypothetical protein [Pseudodesulfovibrio piezophilus]